MRLLEHQAKRLLSGWGIPVPRGRVLTHRSSSSSAHSSLRASVRHVGGLPVVLKAQVYAGGRGKAGGILKANSLLELRKSAKRLLGERLVTAQTGALGVPVKALLIEECLSVLKEWYVGFLIDRSKGSPVAVAAKEGGIEIEKLAAREPGLILKEPFDPLLGLLPFQARRIVDWLAVGPKHSSQAAEQLLQLSRGFLSLDASLVEINPWALTREKGPVALDAKITLDDNGLFRHPETERLKAQDSDTPMEAKSRKIGISYVGLTGNVGCMVNGAGLAMATMDLIKFHGGEPANFLDVGGGADVHQVREAFRLIVADPKVKAILVNIFGGIMKCDVIAQGIIEAAQAVRVRVPLVVRLEGTNVQQGRKMLEESGLGFITATDMNDAARKAARAAKAGGVRPLFEKTFAKDYQRGV